MRLIDWCNNHWATPTSSRDTPTFMFSSYPFLSGRGSVKILWSQFNSTRWDKSIDCNNHWNMFICSKVRIFSKFGSKAISVPLALTEIPSWEVDSFRFSYWFPFQNRAYIKACKLKKSAIFPKDMESEKKSGRPRKRSCDSLISFIPLAIRRLDIGQRNEAIGLRFETAF
jgi:hypothetical protein